MTGLIFAVHRASLHDGPGLRTTVFFQGCPLRCQWCHNPESQSCRPRLRYQPRDCLHCGACVAACAHHNHQLLNGVHTLDRSQCDGCGDCAQQCPSAALSLQGQAADIPAILRLVERDALAAQHSGGGLTLSGGEPLAQPELAWEILSGAKAKGIHTCIETSGHAAWAVLGRLLPLVDVWLWDCKAVDAQLHRRLTGVEPQRIHENLDRLLMQGAQVELRCPLVPGLNDGEAELSALAAWIHARPQLQRVWLMPYHRLGVAKAETCGVFTLDQPSATKADMQRWLACLAQRGISAQIAA